GREVGARGGDRGGADQEVVEAVAVDVADDGHREADALGGGGAGVLHPEGAGARGGAGDVDQVDGGQELPVLQSLAPRAEAVTPSGPRIRRPRVAFAEEHRRLPPPVLASKTAASDARVLCASILLSRGPAGSAQSVRRRRGLPFPWHFRPNPHLDCTESLAE